MKEFCIETVAKRKGDSSKPPSAAPHLLKAVAGFTVFIWKWFFNHFQTRPAVRRPNASFGIRGAAFLPNRAGFPAQRF
jgi:hypothetical protein